MKKCTSFLSLLTVLALIFSLFPSNASASSYAKSPTTNNFYLIQHVGSGKYLDITDESMDNGARLQIWARFQKHQNQVFRFVKSGNSWKIVAHHSGKVLEVRNSSRDDGAPIAQWDDANNYACKRWEIICNNDGTVSFKNCNSGKFMDVAGNGNTNGVKLIQYTSNNTTAQKFKLYRLYNNDILNAKWTRKISNSEISWTKANINSIIPNYTHYSKSGYYPTPNRKYLTKVEYMDADTVHNMLVKKGLNKTTLQKIKDVLKGEMKEEAAAYFIKKTLKYDVPGVGIAVGVLETLSLSNSDQDWNNFANTTRSGKGIKKTTYVTIVKVGYWGPLNNGTTAYGWNYVLKEVNSYTYELWDGNGKVNPPSGYSGSWIYTFK